MRLKPEHSHPIITTPQIPFIFDQYSTSTHQESISQIELRSTQNKLKNPNEKAHIFSKGINTLVTYQKHTLI